MQRLFYFYFVIIKLGLIIFVITYNVYKKNIKLEINTNEFKKYQ